MTMILRWLIMSAAMSIFVQTSGSSSLPDRHTNSTQSVDDAMPLPKEKQISWFLKENEYKRFTLLSEKAGIPLSIALTPCSSPVHWTVYYVNKTGASELLKDIRSGDLDTLRITSSKIGEYVTEVRTLEKGTLIQIFASAEPEPPHEVRMAQRSKVRLQPRQRRRRVTVKWDQSPIDPHVTEYCLVVSSRRNYTSLCSARGDRYGPNSNGPGIVRGNTSKMGNNGNPRIPDDLLISCVGPRTHHTLDNLEHGKAYFVSLFAINKDNDLTFPYGSEVVQYDKKIKHARLRDGKIENVNLKKLDGKAVFRFKTGRQTGDSMAVFVIPCGGAVDVEVLLQGSVVANRSRLYSYEQFLIPSVRKGQRYIIKVVASNEEELRRTSGVEVLATTKKKLPLPELPKQTEVKHFSSLRKCDSVTVGWLPSPDPKAVRYCVVARELRRKESEGRLPNQCQLETKLRKSAEYSLIRCRNRKSPDERSQLMTEEISGLKPNRRYVVQVTVKKSGGGTLSYNLLTVQTTSKCQ